MDRVTDEGAIGQMVKAIGQHDPAALTTWLQQVVRQQVDPEIIRQAIVETLQQQRHDQGSTLVSLPEFLLTLQAVERALDILAATSVVAPSRQPPLVIGVVAGDPHDLGKNIVARVYRLSGYSVTDLGLGVTSEGLLRVLDPDEPAIVGLSAMMSTSMTHIPPIIEAVKRHHPATTFLVGGAAVSRDWAAKVGADGYAESAVTVLEETNAALLRTRQRRARP